MAHARRMTHDLQHAMEWAEKNTVAIARKDAAGIVKRRAAQRATWHKHKGKYKPQGNQLIAQRLSALLRNNIAATAQCSPKLEPFLGCTIPQLRAQLESQWKPGMGWHNYGRSGWVVDHIRATSTFDLSQSEQAALCYHHSNLQPLWEKENLLKRHHAKLSKIKEATAAILDGRIV